jgi:hypothetical protein
MVLHDRPGLHIVECFLACDEEAEGVLSRTEGFNISGTLEFLSGKRVDTVSANENIALDDFSVFENDSGLAGVNVHNFA